MKTRGDAEKDSRSRLVATTERVLQTFAAAYKMSRCLIWTDGRSKLSSSLVIPTFLYFSGFHHLVRLFQPTFVFLMRLSRLHDVHLRAFSMQMTFHVQHVYRPGVPRASLTTKMALPVSCSAHCFPGFPHTRLAD